MSIRGFAAATLAVAAVLISGSGANAAFDSFEYTSTVSAVGGAPGGFAGSQVVMGAGGGATDTVTLTALSETGLLTPTVIRYGNIATTRPDPNTTATYNFNYDFKLTFTTDPGGPQQDTFIVDILGNISGTVATDAGGNTSFNLVNTFVAPLFPAGANFPVIGGVYNVSVGPLGYTPPGTNPGTFAGLVRRSPSRPRWGSWPSADWARW